MANLDERTVFAQTVYAEARGECYQGQEWVAWVIKTRAFKNKSYWGGSSIKAVCLKDGQFECWNSSNRLNGMHIRELQIYNRILKMTNDIYDLSMNSDPTNGSDHYINPRKLSHIPEWTKNCHFIRSVGNHNFYRSK